MVRIEWQDAHNSQDEGNQRMQPHECRNYQTCGAAVCPLQATRGVHLVGERVCLYILASGKVGAADRYEGFQEFERVLHHLPDLMIRFPAIRRAVERAAKQPLRQIKAGTYIALNQRKGSTGAYDTCGDGY
jgi:hypothetical protein